MPIRRPHTPISIEKNDSLGREIAEYILRNPDHIFEELEKTIEVIASKPHAVTKRQVSIIYRTEVCKNQNSPTFGIDTACVSWLITEYNKPIGTSVELANVIETLSGLKAADLPVESSKEVEDQNKDTAKKVQKQLPASQAPDISEWLVHNAGSKED